MNLQFLSSSTTSRELRFEMREKLKKINMYWQTSFMEIFILKPLVVGK